MGSNKIDKDNVIKIKKWFLHYIKSFNCNDNQCRSATLLKLEKKNGAGYGFSARLPDSPDINENVYSDLLHKRIVNSENVFCLNDLKLLRLGWIYDINFIPTFKLIKERDYLRRIQSTLPQSNVKVKKVCAEAQAYFDEIINGSGLTSFELSNCGFLPVLPDAPKVFCD